LIGGLTWGEEQYLASEEDVEQCCATLFRSQLFIRNADKVRYELISIAKTVNPDENEVN
jgi:hypothetical protein